MPPGAFTTTITPQAGEEGLWRVEATDSSKGQCTATTGFEVVGVARHPYADAHPHANTNAHPSGG